MSSPQPLPLQERVTIPSTLQRLRDLAILFLLLALLFYRLTYFHTADSRTVWQIAFLCESCIAFIWFLNVNIRWNPVYYKTYPERFSKRLEDLSKVDMFVTTADPILEPPVVTVNTVLSLLAVEYPANKLACYVSDDGGSPLTYYALCEASKFAKLWVPFCKKYNVQVRAPFVYFVSEREPPDQGAVSSGFVQDWMEMKMEYEELCRKIEGADEERVPSYVKDEFMGFSGRGNHPSIVKMRVSGVMTNAPFVLNVDCDMFANNPGVILHGMCLLHGFPDEISSGYVQAPQEFYAALDDDPFGNQLVVLQKKWGLGLGGIQGPFYGGTGCFHRRKIIYGVSPRPEKTDGPNGTLIDRISYESLQGIYGSSKELMDSAKEIISKKSLRCQTSIHVSSRIQAAREVAACTYECNTHWGREVGWMYGSMVEDVLTGLQIQAKGWRSVYLTPNPPAFLGSAPTGGPASLTQYKRWATGLMEILFRPNGPIVAAIYKELKFRQFLVYLWLCGWPLWAVVEVCYSLLPAYCLLANSSFLPKASSPEFLLPAVLFVTYMSSNFINFREYNLSFRCWWNNQRMNRICSATAFLFGFFIVLLKIVGLSETVFEVTRKDQNNSPNGSNLDPRKFTFDSSPFFVPGTALMLVHVAGLAAAGVKLLGGGGEQCRWGFGEVACSVWVVLSFWPFVRGIFGKGSYGIPWAVIWKALVLGCIFLQVCGLGRLV